MSKTKTITWDEFNKKFVGKKVKLISNTSNENPYVGRKLTIMQTTKGSSKVNPTSSIRVEETSSYYYYRDFDWKPENTIEDFEKEIKELESEKNIINSEIESIRIKVEFMKDNKLKDFDEDTFKAFAILKELKKTSSDIQKARLISKIIKG